MSFVIRQATSDDIETMASIYNEAILEGGFTGDIEPVTLESRESWFSDHINPYRVFVIQVQDAVVGYISISPYRKGRQAFGNTCEISYYLFSHARGKGLGKRLLGHAIDYAQTAGFRVVVALLLACNDRSIRLLKSFGFSESGRIPEAACIGTELVDHLYMSLQVKDQKIT
ncbi:MAG: GNAT family N-acetyltransferase [Cyanobacteriota bacterium]